MLKLNIMNENLELRDYFAAQAMTALISALATPEGYENSTQESLVIESYEIADTMLKHRSI